MTRPGSRRFRAAIASLAWALAAAPAAAQEASTPQAPPAPRAYSLQITGGLVLPAARAAGASGPGWNVSVGAEASLRDRFGLRAQYLYARFGRNTPVPVQGGGTQAPGSASLDAKLQSHTGFFDLVARLPPRRGRLAAYFLAGPLVSLRRVTITAPSGPGYFAYSGCHPQWLQCSAAPIAFDRALGIRRATSPGVSAGAGVSFDVGLTARLVVEARYVYLSGPSFTAADGRTRSASASYLPVTVGLRF